MAWFPCFVQVEGSGNLPDGKTVIPINSVAVWLQCAGLSGVYSSVSEVLSDIVTLQALIQSANAVDYMVRSTSFASDVCSDETSMQLIGANSYCAETLLTNVTWMNEICNSQYFEEVLNVKVPIMTSNTTPSGVVSADSVMSSQYPAYYAFDNNDATLWCGRSYPVTVFYEFVNSLKIFKMDYKGVAVGNTAKTADIIDGNNEVIQNISFENVATLQSFVINNSPTLNKVGLKITEGWGENGHANTLQFYGRSFIPSGKTVTPVNDVSTWLSCAERSESYTELSQVLADTTVLTALLQSNNANDYLARSTAWASDVCADSTAMTIIGANDYCADTLLADNTWCNAICNSAYFESVLNIKVPEMTSNTTPSGEVFYSSMDSRSPNPWHVFNSTNYGQSYENGWMSEEFTGAYIGYEFEDDVKIYMCRMLQAKVGEQRCCKQFKVRCGELHTEVSNTLELPNDDNYHIFTFNSAQISGDRWEIDIINEWTSSVYAALSKCQFYGRAQVNSN